MSRSPGLSASRRHVSAAARVYSSLDARSTVRVSTDDGRDLLTRPGCGRPNARTRRQNYPRDVVSLHASSRRRRACGRPCDVAPVSEERTPSGCAATTRRRGSTGRAESSSPERSPRRDRHRARDRRSAAAGRAGLSLPLCGSLPALGRSTRRNTVVSSSKRSARVQLLAHHSGRRAAAAAAAALCKESHLPAFPAAS